MQFHAPQNECYQNVIFAECANKVLKYLSKYKLVYYNFKQDGIEYLNVFYSLVFIKTKFKANSMAFETCLMENKFKQ